MPRSRRHANACSVPPRGCFCSRKRSATSRRGACEFRRACLPRPWPHLWQADESVASIAIERDYHGEPGVFFGFIKAPEKLSLRDLSTQLEDWKNHPVEAIRPFRRQIRFARLPTPARRLLWNYATSWSGTIKARNFGTFGISLTGASGSTALNLIGPLTTAINTGVIQDDGSVDVRMHFDHRVVDGMPVAHALEELEDTLRTEIVAELTAMAEAQCEERVAARGSSLRPADIVAR